VEKDIVPVESSPIVVPAITPEKMVEQMDLFQKLKAQLLDPKTDVVDIKGKPYVKRSGWRKLALAFNISDEVLSTEKEEVEGGYVWRIQVRAWAPNGRSAVGIGACSSTEREFAHPDHDIYAIAHTRAKNRAISDLIGSGEVSAEELRATRQENSPSERRHPPVRSQEQAVYDALERAGLDSSQINVFLYGRNLRVQTREELGELWHRYDEVLAPLGAIWKEEAGRWEIPKEAD